MPSVESDDSIYAKCRCSCVPFVCSHSPRYKPITRDTLSSFGLMVNTTFHIILFGYCEHVWLYFFFSFASYFYFISCKVSSVAVIITHWECICLSVFVHEIFRKHGVFYNAHNRYLSSLVLVWRSFSMVTYRRKVAIYLVSSAHWLAVFCCF